MLKTKNYWTLKLNRRYTLLLACLFASLQLAAQYEPQPGYFIFPIKPGERNYLSGTMGEIRSNHFHGGLDIKTDQREGLNVYAAADGYISRIKQSTYGYGNIVYITHPNGLTTTYAHLQAFAEPLASAMLQKQYEKQAFELEFFPEKNQFPVKAGDIIGLSGNTGGSGGPHLHFEIRDAEDRLYNPLRYKFPEIIDTTPPEIHALAIQPLNIHTRVNDEFSRKEMKPVKKGNNLVLPDTVYAYGLLGLELQTIDKLDGASNSNGTQEVALFVNNKPAYRHVIEQVPFQISRQVSQHINYDSYRRYGSTFQKVYVDYGNELPLYTTSENGGRLTIHADSVYHVRLEARDSYNNTKTLNFIIKGKEPVFTKTLAKDVKKLQLSYEVLGNVLKISATDTSETPRNVELFVGNKRHVLVPSYTRNSASVNLYDLRAGLPDSILFCDISKKFDYQAAVPSGHEFIYKNNYLSIVFAKESLYDTLFLETRLDGDLYTIGDYFTPLYKPVKVTITPPNTIIDKSKAAVYFLGTGRGRSYTGGTWEGNSLTFITSNMGKFKVMEDVKPPFVRLISKSKNQISFKISDDLSGLNSFRAEVNGEWLLMKYEHKTATIYSEKLDKSIPLSGKVVLTVKDNAGNETTFTTTI